MVRTQLLRVGSTAAKNPYSVRADLTLRRTLRQSAQPTISLLSLTSSRVKFLAILDQPRSRFPVFRLAPASIEIRNQPTAQRAPAVDPRSGSGSILLDATSCEDLEGRRDRDVSAIIHSRMFT
jgi:hypothetical protein